MALTQDEPQVRLRLPLPVCLFPTVFIIPQLATYLQLRLRPRHYPYGHADGWLPLSCLLVVAFMAVLLHRRGGTTLTPTEVRVNNSRRKRIPWARVQAISDEWYLGSKRVILWTDDGQRIPLHAPVTLLGNVGRWRFDRDFHRIGYWWLAHRGPDWRPIPPEFRR